MPESKELKPRSPDDDEAPEGGTEQTFISHLVELRTRLLRAMAAVAVTLLAMMPFSNRLYSILSAPLMAKMPEGTTMIATEVASSFYAPFVLTAFTAFMIALPYVFYQGWSFVAPGLYLNERKLALPLLVSSVLLFYTGIAFCYFFVFPIAFGFFTSTAPEGVKVMTDITHYLDFVIKMFMAFGAAFEVPVATFLMVRTGMTTAQDLSEKRPYVIVGAFTIAAVLTPPDVLSQCLLAIPIWMLYEVGLLFSKHFVKPDEEEAEDATALARTDGSTPE